MDAEVMEFRIKQWIPIFEEQARSGLGKEDWCEANGISRNSFFKWQREIRKFMLANNLKVPNIANEYFQTEPGFVDITPEVVAPAIERNEPEQMPCSFKPPAVFGLSIRYGRFSIDINESTDERLLSMALGVVSNVK
jgi:hypothetical protein